MLSCELLRPRNDARSARTYTRSAHTHARAVHNTRMSSTQRGERAQRTHARNARSHTRPYARFRPLERIHTKTPARARRLATHAAAHLRRHRNGRRRSRPCTLQPSRNRCGCHSRSRRHSRHRSHHRSYLRSHSHSYPRSRHSSHPEAITAPSSSQPVPHPPSPQPAPHPPSPQPAPQPWQQQLQPPDRGRLLFYCDSYLRMLKISFADLCE